MAGQLAVKLSALGGRVCVEGREGETIITAKSDGTSVAGQVVGIPIATGIAAGTDDAAFEYFSGIQLERYDTDCDTAVTAGLMIEIVIPKTGRRYNCAIVDPAADKDQGQGFVFGTTAGNLEIGGGDIVVFEVAHAFTGIANTSRFADLVWGHA